MKTVKRLVMILAGARTPVDAALSAEGDVALANACLSDTLAAMALPALRTGLGVETELVLPPSLPEGNSTLSHFVSLYREKFAEGYERLVLVTGSTPHLPAAFVLEAFGRLDAGVDVVIGPADDGSCYLLGMKQTLPAVYPIRWWEAGALPDLVTLLKGESLSCAQLPLFYTVDSSAGLAHLQIDSRRGLVQASTVTALLANKVGEGEDDRKWKRDQTI